MSSKLAAYARQNGATTSSHWNLWALQLESSAGPFDTLRLKIAAIQLTVDQPAPMSVSGGHFEFLKTRSAAMRVYDCLHT